MSRALNLSKAGGLLNSLGQLLTGGHADASITPAKLANSGYELGMRNRIINGGMVIDQRNAGASVSNANSYTLDRWYFMQGQASATVAFNVQQSSTAPANFANSLGITVATAASPGLSNYSCLYHRVEGYNAADLNYGLSSALASTLSFWVNSSVTGTFGVAIQNSANARSYVGSYTINSANTWEYKTITIPGDTTGTWLKTNGIGVGIYWDMGVGTAQSTTAGTWQAGNYLGLTSGTKLSATSGAIFYITGVQLEKGSTATSFDYRPYGTELALCQRYLPCFRIDPAGGNKIFGNMFWNTSTTVGVAMPFMVPARDVPTGVTTNGTFIWFGNNNAGSITGITFNTNTSANVGYVTGTTGAVAAGFAGAAALQAFGSYIYFTGCEL